MIVDPLRLSIVAGMLLTYVLMCVAIGRVQLRKRRAAAQLAATQLTQQVTQQDSHQGAAPTWIIAYASQTGTAEELALQTADTLHLAGVSARLCSLSELTLTELGRAERVLFLVSTYGEGDPPDNAALFASQFFSTDVPLTGLHYAVLALGDSTYANYCGFGKVLDRRLQQYGAQAMFERIEVDCGEATAIAAWRQRLSHLAGTSDLPDWGAPDFSDWTLVERRELNPGSAGEPVFHLELAPLDATLPDWYSGDLAQVQAPGEHTHPREYSIASLPSDGRIHLLVRLHRHPDGKLGAASGWLAVHAALGTCVKMRLRSHRRFRLEDNATRPLILIGNGTGIAGLRSHLKARIGSGAGPNWLIFGERNAACDAYYRDEIEEWKADGLLQRADMVYSRDQSHHRYVQDCLLDVGELLRGWIEQGAAIYVCGSLKGMAVGVDAALTCILGRALLDELGMAGRYRRDVY